MWPCACGGNRFELAPADRFANTAGHTSFPPLTRS